jgi:hypothetical protein
MLFTIKMKKRGRSRAATLHSLGLRTVRRVARERGKVRGKRLGHGPSHVTSGSARYNIDSPPQLHFLSLRADERRLYNLDRIRRTAPEDHTDTSKFILYI